MGLPVTVERAAAASVQRREPYCATHCPMNWSSSAPQSVRGRDPGPPPPLLPPPPAPEGLAAASLSRPEERPDDRIGNDMGDADNEEDDDAEDDDDEAEDEAEDDDSDKKAPFAG